MIEAAQTPQIGELWIRNTVKDYCLILDTSVEGNVRVFQLHNKYVGYYTSDTFCRFFSKAY